ncbi:MAG: hypothetical protein L6R40_007912 [Gallowayella cf. fulva]|nr:MAG: hypothetical protein L6R40_007912 [Xanthomendoza cf. fulva]
MSNSSGQRIPINRFGLTEVYAPATRPNVDIVFVHGLNGKPSDTWTSESTHVFWPAQTLPPELEDESLEARVLVYGYDADVTSFTDGASKDKIHNHAEHLIAELVANRRRKAAERPIIWVAHSLGGLVVKRALIYSAEIRGLKTEHYRSIFVSTYGILFLGTPHHGSDIAQWGNRLEWICSVMLPKKVMDSQPQLIDALKTNNETLQNIDRQFIQILDRFHIYFFHEGKPTNLKGTLKFVRTPYPSPLDVHGPGAA